MKILFHIGTDKTGSTAIQQHLILNRDWFAARSVYIPEIGFGKSNGHSALLSHLGEEQCRDLREEIKRAEREGFDLFLLSWEGLNFYSPSEIAVLSDLVGGRDAVVLVYLREQADLVQTGFLQQLKSNSNKTSITVFEKPAIGLELLQSRMLRYPVTRNYEQLLRRWEKGLPAARICVRLFESGQLKNGDIVDDFLESIGLETDSHWVRRQDTANISLDVVAGLLVDRWQCAGVVDQDILRRIDIAVSHIAQHGGGEKNFLGERLVARIRRHYRASNRRVARRYLGRKGPLFGVEKTCWQKTSPEDIATSVDQLAAQIEQVDQAPTLSNRRIEGEVLAGVALSAGWHDRNRWGAWSHGESSVIKFRIWRRRIGPGCTGIAIMIEGRYAGDNGSTHVLINGADYGELNLAGPRQPLTVPLELLLPYERVDITLHHQSPLTPGGSAARGDREEIAFGLERVSYKYL